MFLPGHAISSILLAAGLLLLSASALGDLGYVRFAAVVLLTAAGAGIGIAAGIAPRTAQPERATPSFFRRSAWVAAVLLVAPALMALAATLFGAVGRLGEAVPVAVGAQVGGGAIALILLAAATAALAVAIRAMRAREPDRASADPEQSAGKTP